MKIHILFGFLCFFYFGLAIGEPLPTPSDKTTPASSPWVGIAFRPLDKTPWWSRVGFSNYYTQNFHFDGGAVRKNKILYLRTTLNLGKFNGAVDPVIYEVKMTIEKNKIKSLEFTNPMETPCVVKDNNAYCNYVGRNETTCLESAVSAGSLIYRPIEQPFLRMNQLHVITDQ